RFYLSPSYASAKPGEAEALDLLMRIAASGSVSKLYKKLVIEEKKAASAGGWYSDSGLDSGRLGFYAIAAEKVSAGELEKAIDGVIADLRENGVTQAELDRARASYIAEFVYTSDSQSRMARHYGWRLATGMTTEDVEAWPERLKKVTVDDVKAVAQKYLVDKNSVTGYLLPAPENTSSAGEKPTQAPSKGKSEPSRAMRFRLPLFLRLQGSILAAAALVFSTAQAAEGDGMKIERVVSPGGIEAWLVEGHTNPLIAIRFAFRGGASQDDQGKEGLAYFVSAMMDEGAGDLNAIAFQERAQELAMRMDFDAGRDVMLGNVQTLTANKDHVFDLVRLAMTKPRFDEDAIERVRAQILAGLKFDENDPETVASLAWDRLAFQNHPYGRPIKGTAQSISSITRDDLKNYARR